MTVGESEYETRGKASLTTKDWTSAVETAKAWMMVGGGAWRPEPWLLRAAGHVLHGQPRTAVNEIDRGLHHWVQEPRDRALLLWARGSIQLRFLADPRGASSDFEAAARTAPGWMHRLLIRDQVACSAAACRSCSPGHTVQGAPAYDADGVPQDAVAPADPSHAPGSEPTLWAELRDVLAPVSR